MSLLEQGGPLMWPLLALSILGFAIILDRAIMLSTFGFPARGLAAALTSAVQKGDAVALRTACAGMPAALHPFLSVLLDGGYTGDRSRALHLLGEDLLHELSRRVGVLGLIVRIAPLIGLLGTVQGMIGTFSSVAAAGGGIDMAGLAGGIWQALLTTAAGLGIAIPALAAQQWCNHRIDSVADGLGKLADAALAVGISTKQCAPHDRGEHNNSRDDGNSGVSKSRSNCDSCDSCDSYESYESGENRDSGVNCNNGERNDKGHCNSENNCNDKGDGNA